jgi:tetratricopeptide (TPR) repeat protein
VAAASGREDRIILGQAYNNLANRLKSGGSPAETRKAYQDAIAVLRPLAEEFPGIARYRQELATCLTNWATFLMDTGQPAEAEPGYREAHLILKRLVEDYPAVPGYRWLLATLQSNRGKALRLTGHFPEAEACLNDALAMRRKLLTELGDSPALHNSLALTLSHLGDLRRVQQQYGAACDFLQEAAGHHEAALKAAPRTRSYRDTYRQNRVTLADSLMHLGDHAAAAVVAEQILQIGLDPSTDAYEAACILALCASVAEKDDRLTPEQSKQKVELYANQAMKLLREAIQKGFQDLDHLRRDSELAALRSRKDFTEFLAQLEAKEKLHKK